MQQWKGINLLKRLSIGLLVILLLCGVFSLVLAEESNYQGEVTALVGNDHSSIGWMKYHLTDQLDFTALYDDEYEAFKAGVEYDFTDRFGVMAGIRYDFNDKNTIGYGGFDFVIPFASNLELSGYYDYNYAGENWSRYETAIRIEMYKGNYLYAGVRGNRGSGAPIYDYNKDNEALLFMRGDFSWQFGKFGLHLKPLLYIQGEYFHNYDLKYTINDHTNFILNINSLEDQELNYRAGIEFKF